MGGRRWSRMAFVVDDEPVSWHVVRSVSGDALIWREINRRVAGVLGDAIALSDERLLSDVEVARCVRTLRIELGLFAAEDFEHWLTARDLSSADVTEWLQHGPRGARAMEVAEPGAGQPPEREATWVAGICTGALRQVAHDVAAREAVHRHLAEIGATVARDEALALFTRLVADSAPVDRIIAGHVLEWTLIEGDWVTFTSDTAAREALLCVRDDGLTLSQVASEAGTSVCPRTFLLEDVEDTLAIACRSAREGDAVGPIAIRDGVAIGVVTTKALPSATLPEVRARARAHAVARAVDDLVRKRVRWCESG